MSTSTSHVPTLPGDVQQLMDEFAAVEEETDGLLGGLDDEQFNWCPPGGGWSVAQCFDHLNVAGRVYLEAMRPALARARQQGWTRRGAIESTWFGERFVRSLEPPVTLKTRAPKKIRPADRRHKAEVWPEFVRVTGEVRHLLAEVGDLDLNRATFQNPFLPLVRVRAGTGFRILAAHDRRHVAQAASVRALDGFPRS